MNDQSQIEAKIIHLTPPQRFQVVHQLPRDCPEVPNPVRPTTKGEEFKVVTTNPSKIWAIRILNGTWLLVSLFLKRCTRIDKNLLVVYVALVLLLLQVFMVIARAEAGPQNRRIFNSEYNLSPLIAAGRPSTFCVGFLLLGERKLPAAVWLDPKSTKREPVGESNFGIFCSAVTTVSGPDKVYDWADMIARTGQRPSLNLIPLMAAGGASTFWLDPKSTKKIKGFPKVPWAPDSARLLSARAEGCFHLVPGEGECRGLQPKALSAHRPASDSKPYWHCRKARRNYEGFCRAVTPVSVVGNVYERSDMSAFSSQSLAPVNERRNHLPQVIAHITGDVSQIKPLITKTANLIADRQHTRIAQTFNQHNSRNAPLAVQFIDRSPVTLAKNPPWQLRLADTYPGTHAKAAGAAAAFLCLLSFRCRKES
ncbi:MAG TPA: hypothetical protein VGE06_05565, partial [Flavisolibacter sp.]